MTKKDIKSKQGFTIIEVVLVLAIAGLIFLMVFIALPNLQRNQRDSQRRQDYAALSANMTQYMANNSGNLPSAGATLAANRYINVDGKDPGGQAYDLKPVVKLAKGGKAEIINPMAKSGKPKVYVYTMAKCTVDTESGNTIPMYNTSTRAFAIYAQLETGTYCQSSDS